MNLVVNFLSMLVAEEENGGVKRMLGVCSEFERIAKVVLDKADKESSSRRKRKNNEEQVGKAKPQSAAPPQTPMNNSNGHTPSMAGVFSPGSMLNPMPPNGFSPAATGSPNWNQDYNNGSDYATPRQGGMTPYSEIQGYTNGSGNDITSPLNMNNFQQPFVPQDLWQMPMTLDWDWAEMTTGAYPSFENGIMGDASLQHVDNQHLQHQHSQQM
jgi:hypothetical protein